MIKDCTPMYIQEKINKQIKNMHREMNEDRLGREYRSKEGRRQMYERHT
jgi:hypothetical protein